MGPSAQHLLFVEQRRNDFCQAMYEETRTFFVKNYISFHNNRIISISTYDAATDALSSNSIRIEFDSNNNVTLIPVDCLDTGYFFKILNDIKIHVLEYKKL